MTAPILGVWPLHVAGAVRAMMQEPHLVQYWSSENGPLGAAGTSIIALDAARAKCLGSWTNASRAVGAPSKALSWQSCLCSLVGKHMATQVGPPSHLPVGYPTPAISMGAPVPANPSETWKHLEFEAFEVDPLDLRPVSSGAFGSWWPPVQQVLADVGTMLSCTRSACSTAGGSDGCLWAVIGRLVSELRPWEDFIGSDNVPLLAAALEVAWLSDAEVLVCEESEDNETGAVLCDCSAQLPRLPGAAFHLLELLMEIVLAGHPGNLRRLFTQLMVSDSWQSVYFCSTQAMGLQRYLAVDRGDMELPPRARQQLRRAQGAPVPLEELLADRKEQTQQSGM